MTDKRITMLIWLVMNLVTVSAWLYLAIHFDKWWIFLFSVLTLFRYKNDDKEEGNDDK